MSEATQSVPESFTQFQAKVDGGRYIGKLDLGIQGALRSLAEQADFDEAQLPLVLQLQSGSVERVRQLATIITGTSETLVVAFATCQQIISLLDSQDVHSIELSRSGSGSI